jgi:large subunit ribosomal protein L24
METPTKMKLKKGDQIVVIAGKEKGKTGTVAKVSPATNRVVVTGLNIIKKATSRIPRRAKAAGLLRRRRPSMPPTS